MHDQEARTNGMKSAIEACDWIVWQKSDSINKWVIVYL